MCGQKTSLCTSDTDEYNFLYLMSVDLTRALLRPFRVGRSSTSVFFWKPLSLRAIFFSGSLSPSERSFFLETSLPQSDRWCDVLGFCGTTIPSNAPNDLGWSANAAPNNLSPALMIGQLSVSIVISIVTNRTCNQGALYLDIRFKTPKWSHCPIH